MINGSRKRATQTYQMLSETVNNFINENKSKNLCFSTLSMGVQLFSKVKADILIFFSILPSVMTYANIMFVVKISIRVKCPMSRFFHHPIPWVLTTMFITRYRNNNIMVVINTGAKCGMLGPVACERCIWRLLRSTARRWSTPDRDRCHCTQSR